MHPFFIGTAGWTIAREHAHLFEQQGTHLERYARLFSAVEINTTFYRLHKPATFAKWAAATPDNFRFAVKVPRDITHYGGLREMEKLHPFLEGVAELGEKAGPLLVQLPPKLAFDGPVAEAFFTVFRENWSGDLVCEPRHESWFVPEVDELLRDFRVARVAADPPRGGSLLQPAGWTGLAYYRLHGKPRIYYSEYDEDFLAGLSTEISLLRDEVPVWCFFDNTASGAAVGNALWVKSKQSSATGSGPG